MTKRILSLRSKFSAATSLPFDKMYFVKREDEDVIPKMLPVCLRLKITKANATAMHKMLTNDLVNIHGGVTTPNAKFAETDIPESMPLAKELQAALITGGTALDQWWMVIPLLLANTRPVAGEVPVNSRLVYLRNRSWQPRKSKKSVLIQTIPDSSALLVYGTEISPPCLACPLLMEHIAGKCELGTALCLKSLGLVHKTQYKRNLEKYGTGVIDASVLTDDAE